MITALYAVYAIISVLLIVIILMQKSKTQGLSVTFGGTSIGDSFYNRNKSKTFEGKLETLTKIGIFVFMVLAVALNYMISTQPKASDLTKTPEGTIPSDITGKPFTQGSQTTNTTGVNVNQGTGAATGTTTAPATTTSPATTAPVQGNVAPVAPVTPATTTTTNNQ